MVIYSNGIPTPIAFHSHQQLIAVDIAVGRSSAIKAIALYDRGFLIIQRMNEFKNEFKLLYLGQLLLHDKLGCKYLPQALNMRCQR
jgi:hypothetical protein